jgi:hypothetical protein
LRKWGQANNITKELDMKKLLITFCTAAALVGCSQNQGSGTDQTGTSSGSSAYTNTPSTPTPSTPPATAPGGTSGSLPNTNSPATSPNSGNQ